jgi:hypothetical protein
MKLLFIGISVLSSPLIIILEEPMQLVVENVKTSLEKATGLAASAGMVSIRVDQGIRLLQSATTIILLYKLVSVPANSSGEASLKQILLVSKRG